MNNGTRHEIEIIIVKIWIFSFILEKTSCVRMVGEVPFGSYPIAHYAECAIRDFPVVNIVSRGGNIYHVPRACYKRSP